MGSRLPACVRDSFLVADGQDLDAPTCGGLFYGLYLLPLDEVVNEWTFWRQVEKDPRTGANPAVLATMASIPPQWVKPQYTSSGWLPLISDRSGNYVGVDLDPGPGGQWGQTIIFGRDFDRKCVLWRGEGEGGWATWLASFVDEVESGDGWVADKTGSDEEDELGYASYSASDMYGVGGQGLRLAGEYKGWNVLEAWWDRSVKKWEGLGLGMDVAEIERGLDEARRLANTNVKGKGKQREDPRGEREREREREREGSDDVDYEGIRAEQRTPLPEVPTVSTPDIATPNRPKGAEDDEALLPPVSPDMGSIPRILHPQHTPIPASRSRAPTADHPLKDTVAASDLLSPPMRSTRSNSGDGSSGGSGSSSGSARKPRRPPPPAPAMLDLPTRADVQAAEAVAQAEASGLRGGWVMNLDASAGAAKRRAELSHHTSPSMAEMVDIDLEGGRYEAFSAATPTSMTAADAARQDADDRLAHAGIEHRRSPLARAPSPLVINGLGLGPVGPGSGSGPGTPRTGTPPIRRPPQAADSPRALSPVVGDTLPAEVVRGIAAVRRASTTSSAPQPTKKDSTGKDSLGSFGSAGPQRGLSHTSADGLLDAQAPTPLRTGGSPRANGGGNGSGVLAENITDEPDVADQLEEIKL
jgi:cell wall assembly regulator SMI1